MYVENIYSSEQSYEVKRVLVGENGSDGKAGLGGFTGDTAISCFNTYFVIQDHLNKYKPSLERALNGYVLNANNDSSYDADFRNQVDIYVEETNFIEFILNSEFKSICLREHDFIAFVINESYLKADLRNLIKRTNLLNGKEYVHLLKYLKSEIIESDDEKLVLDHLVAAVSSMQYRYDAEKQTILVVDVKKYLELTFKQIEKWDKLANQNVRDVYKKNFENNLKKKILEAKYLVDLLQKDVDTDASNMNNNIEIIIKDILRYKNDAREGEKNLLAQKKILEQNMKIKAIFGGLKIACQFLKFLGPKGVLVGSIGEAAFGLGETLLMKDKSPNAPSTQHIDKAVGQYMTYLKNNTKNQLDLINKDLNVLENLNKIQKGSYSSTKSTANLSFEERLKNLPDSHKKKKIQKALTSLKESSETKNCVHTISANL